MMPSAVRPPVVAAWLVGLFTPDRQTESITGDLLEEFSDLTSKSGVSSARRWYWRQSTKTIAHLIGNQFRSSPWLIATTVLGGLVLLTVGGSWPSQGIVALVHLRRHHVTPYYSPSEMKTYFFWLESGIFIGEDVMSLLVGCVVAMAAKGKEMAATMTLGFLATLIHAGIAVSVAKHAHADAFALLRLFPVRLFASAILVVIGGVIVREIRFAAARRLSRA